MSKRLVSYFSASGVTAKLAKTLAAAIGADLFEILPEKPYSAADLDWTNKESRSTIEMNDKSFRPAVANRVENMAEYDAVYVGFPIWWYVAPTIINTFHERGARSFLQGRHAERRETLQQQHKGSGVKALGGESGTLASRSRLAPLYSFMHCPPTCCPAGGLLVFALLGSIPGYSQTAQSPYLNVPLP